MSDRPEPPDCNGCYWPENCPCFGYEQEDQPAEDDSNDEDYERFKEARDGD